MARKYRINIGGEEHVVDVIEHGEKDYLITLDGKVYQARIEDARGSTSEVTQPKVTVSPPSAADTPGAVQICAPLTGTIRTIKVASGDIVKSGQLLCLLEAMKMEIEVNATQNGMIVTVAAKPSDTVRQGDLLFVLRAELDQ